jgi:5'-3' exonuclease
VIPKPYALLIDATTYLYRAYFACRSLIGREGSQVNAVYGFLQTLLALLEERRPDHAAAVFDDPTTPTFRQALFPGYKRSRSPAPERLLPQFEPAMAAARAMGIAPLRAPGFEADDLLATLVRRLRAQSVGCLVVGRDKDLAQIVAPGVWLYPFGDGAPMDEEAVRDRYGVPPDRIPDLLALAGDPVDGLPGVPGIGEKMARRLLTLPGPPESLWEDAAALDVVPPREASRVAEALRQGRGAFLSNRQLTALRRDVPLDLAEGALLFRGIDTDAVRALCDRYGFDQLRDRILALAREMETVSQC